MNKKKIITISTLALFIVLVFFVAMRKGTFSAVEYKYVFENTKDVNLYKQEIQKLVGRTAKAFYYNRDYIQYKSGNMLGLEGIEYSYRDFTVSPEELNENRTVYMDEASFVFSVYMNALGMDLTEGVVENFNIETGSNFDTETLLKIIELEDERLVLESDSLSPEEQNVFITKYLKTLEVGDIIVYTLEDGFHLALYLGIDSDNNPKCIYLYDNSNDSGIYMHDADDYLFPNGNFLSSDTYYAIIRPINSLQFNSVDRVTLAVPVNSLARVDNVYVRRYTDIATSNVYRGEVINYTIEITNQSNEVVTINSISDILDNYLEFVETIDGNYNDENKTISWSNISLNVGETRKFTYIAKVSGETELGMVVSESTVYGKEIKARNAQVSFDGDNELILNSINYTIANKYIDEQEDNLNNVLTRINEVKSYLDYGSGTDEYKTEISKITSDNNVLLDDISFYSFVYYNAFGVDLGINGLTDYDTVKNMLFLVNEETGSYTRNSVNSEDINSININNMVVGNLYGGMSLNDNSKNKIFSPIIKGDYTYSNLVSGDIIMAWNADGEATSYLYVKSLEDDNEVDTLIKFSNEGILKFGENDFDGKIEKVITESSLYVVLRPSMILDIQLEDVQFDPINLRLDEEKPIIFTKKPVNATINTIDYSVSNIFVVNTDTNTIKGVANGSDTLTVTFNEELKKEVKVAITKAINDDIIVTEYEIDNDNNILYVGNDQEVKTILDKISFSADGYDKKIVNSNYEEITETIGESAILEVSLNSELIEQYKIIYFSLNMESNIKIINDEDIIKYVTVGTKVSDVVNSLYFNDNGVSIEFYNSENEKLNDDSLVSTGDYWLFKITDKIQQQYQISVVGDVSGNGIFNGNDVVLTRRHIVGWQNPKTGEIYELSGVYAYAMDFTMNGIVNGNDVSAMRRKLVN